MVKTENKTNYEIINELKKENKFTELISRGIINISMATWHSLYIDFIKEMRKNNHERSICITMVSENFNNRFSERHIYRIIKFMES